jgi:SAM-dependent methyltransferase
MKNHLLPVTRSCPLCSQTAGNNHPDMRNDKWELKVCSNCKFVYLANPPDYEAFVDVFAWEKTYLAEKQRRHSEEPILTLWRPISNFVRYKLLRRKKIVSMLKRFSQSGRILDLGCGSGHQLDGLIGKPHEPWGIEISRALAEKANQLFSLRGGRCIQSDALNGMASMPDEFFDCIIMHSYLEHEIKPREVCDAAFCCLKPGGHVIIKVPNHASWNRQLRKKKWCGYRFPDHVNYFTPCSLVGLLEDSGFTIVKFNWLDRMPTSDNMWIVAKKENLLPQT